jgi:putative YhdH/YhfP family quinone oxidoreductase
MSIGTAGLTAAHALYKMELMNQSPAMGPVVVTGSTGGVGSTAVAILAKAGYEVIAVTGKENAKEYLEHLGASRIESRDFVDDKSGKALIRPKWAGAIDTVGGNTLHTLMKGCMPEGNVVSTGLVASPKLDATVYPFVLNGISVLGIGSAETPASIKIMLWQKLMNEWNIKDKFNAIVKEVSLDEISTYIDSIIDGKIMGRIVIKI